METLPALIEVLQTGGPYAVAGIFVLVWWMEHKDRQAKEGALEHEQSLRLLDQAAERTQQAMSCMEELTAAAYELAAKTKG